jgi:hypothetical protein
MSRTGPSPAALGEALRILAEEKTRRTGQTWIPLPPTDIEAVNRSAAGWRDDDLGDERGSHSAANV